MSFDCAPEKMSSEEVIGNILSEVSPREDNYLKKIEKENDAEENDKDKTEEGEIKEDGKATEKIWREVKTEFGSLCIMEKELKAGSRFGSFEPLLVIPRCTESFLSYKASCKDAAICLGCCRRTVPNAKNSLRQSRCTNCQWPLCLRQSCQTKHQAEGECEVFAKCQIKWEAYKHQPSIYNWIGIIRAAMLKQKVKYGENNPENPAQVDKWSKLMRMDYSEKAALVFPSHVDASYEFIRSKCDIDWISSIEYTKVINILVQNQLICNHDEVDDASHAAIIYEGTNKGTIFQHDCVPNVKVYIDSHTFVAHVVTNEDVPKGGILSISYDPEYPLSLKKFRERQKFLNDNFYTPCRCKMCIDPVTEGGTHFSTVRCPRTGDGNCAGFLIPVLETLALSSKEAVYFCNAPNCEVRWTENDIRKREISIGRYIGDYVGVGDVNREFSLARNFADQLSTKLLHPNHYLNLYAFNHIGLLACRIVHAVAYDIQSIQSNLTLLLNNHDHIKAALKVMKKLLPERRFYTQAWLKFCDALLQLCYMMVELEENSMPLEVVEENVKQIHETLKHSMEIFEEERPIDYSGMNRRQWIQKQCVTAFMKVAEKKNGFKSFAEGKEQGDLKFKNLIELSEVGVFFYFDVDGLVDNSKKLLSMEAGGSGY